MEYVYPFLDDLEAHEEAIIAEVREKLANGRYTSNTEALEVIDMLYSTIEGLREHSAEIEDRLKERINNDNR